MVSQALESLADAVEAGGAQVVVHGTLPTLDADPLELRQVVQNLISNALKFTAGPSPVVDVAAERTDDGWQISVADRGIGIEAEFAERIFGPFKRLHTRDAYPGTGIGLAICRRIVERRGGRIWHEPRPDGGTVFAFTVADHSPAPEPA